MGDQIINNHYGDYQLLVMSKAPQAGRVKTRMQPYLSEQQSAKLHTDLVRYCLQQWQVANLCPIQVFVGGGLNIFQQKILPLLGNAADIGLSTQCSGDLGERMAHAVTSTFTDNTGGVILVGTDCPFIDKAYLQQAIDQLENNTDVVIGPAHDGGYVLLGIKRCTPIALDARINGLFRDMQWGVSSVFAQTQARLQALALNYHVLPSLSDIDIPGDLALLGAITDLSHHAL